MTNEKLADEIERRMSNHNTSHFAFDRPACEQIIAALRKPCPHIITGTRYDC